MPLNITPGLMSAINTGYRTDYNDGLEHAPTFWSKVARRVPSGTAAEVYQMLGDFPSMEEWIGERQRKRLKAVDWMIRNKKYEATLEVPREAIEDDQYGLYSANAKQMGESAAMLPDEIVATLIEAGFTALGYDGVTFFATTHPSDDGTTQSNKGTTALSAASYETTRATMRNYKSAAGKKLNIMPDLLIVGPANEGVAKRIVVSETVATAAGTASETNPNKGTATVLVIPQLTDPNDWFLMDSSKSLKPFIWQERTAPEFVAKTKLDDDSVFWEDLFTWGVRARGNAGYALWQLIFGHKVA